MRVFIKYSILLLSFILIFSFGITLNDYSLDETIENNLLAFAVYGYDFTVSIALPDSWTVNMNYARQVGVNGFFYLNQFSINNSPAAIILELAYKPNEQSKLEKCIEYDTNSILSYYRNSSITELDWNITNENYIFKIFSFNVTQTGHLQYITYIDAGLHYFAKKYVTIIDKNIHDNILNDYINCIKNSKLFDIGVSY